MNIVASQIGKAKIGIVLILLLLVPDGVCSQSLASGVPPDWVQISVGGQFDVMAPAGTKYQPGKGTDSTVGRIVAPGFTLTFDHGLYSNPLNQGSGYHRYVARDVRVDRKTAKIVTAYTPQLSAAHPYFIGIHFPNLRKTGRGPVRLTIFSQLDSPDGYDVVEKIFGTIEFK